MIGLALITIVSVYFATETRTKAAALQAASNAHLYSSLSGQIGTGPGELAMNDAARAVATNASDESAILDTIDRWVERDLRPIVREYDHADRYPDGVVEQMKELGLVGEAGRPDYCGAGSLA